MNKKISKLNHMVIHLVVFKVFQKRKKILSKIYLAVFITVKLLQKINRWIYITQTGRGNIQTDQKSHFVIKNKPCNSETFTGSNKKNSDAKWYVRKKLLNI